MKLKLARGAEVPDSCVRAAPSPSRGRVLAHASPWVAGAIEYGRLLAWVIGVAAGTLGALWLARWAVDEHAGRTFLIGLGAGVAATFAGAWVVDRRRYRRLRDLIGYLGDDLEVRKAAQLPHEHRVRVERSRLEP